MIHHPSSTHSRSIPLPSPVLITRCLFISFVSHPLFTPDTDSSTRPLSVATFCSASHSFSSFPSPPLQCPSGP